MSPDQPKEKFDFSYWLTELIIAGQQATNTVYTHADIQRLRTAWQNQPFSNPVQRTIRRRQEALAVQSVAFPPLEGSGGSAVAANNSINQIQ